jgi:hypothetical protein
VDFDEVSTPTGRAGAVDAVDLPDSPELMRCSRVWAFAPKTPADRRTSRIKTRLEQAFIIYRLWRWGQQE